jgi:lysophospholipase L1-like esterase
MPSVRYRHTRFIAIIVTAVLALNLAACAPEESASTNTASPNSITPSSLITPPSSGIHPSPRTIEYDWMAVSTWNEMHAEDVAVAAQGDIDLLFVGDSITAGWDTTLWQTHFAPHSAANFGIGGDHTGNLLWRLQNGSIGNLQPKVVVLLIGVNNFGHLSETPAQVFEGVSSVVNTLRGAFPHARILLNGVFPYGQAADTPEREQVKALNQLLATLVDSDKLVFEDYGQLFVQEDQTISPEIMGDFLHLTPEGYRLWAEAMLPTLEPWLK